MLAHEVGGRLSHADRGYIDRHQPAGAVDARRSDEPRQGIRPLLPADTAMLEPEAVLVAVGKLFAIPVATLKGRDRTRHVSEARDAAYWLLRRHSRMPAVQMAKAFGRRDHTGALRAVGRCEERRATDGWFREATDRLERELVEQAQGVVS
jgi:chromosomal replication initiation ATPase DnaA